ncbi:unnamed protein product [Trichobilharzia szidati]|nr:unnamed protein product [Trichobilharzia szidati]
MLEGLAATSSDDGYGSDSVSSTSFLPMTQEQKDWLIAIVDCDQPKMTSMLNKHPELAGWKTNINGYTALHYAVRFGDCAIIRLLLGNYQVPVDAQTYEGTTALHLAAASGNEDVIVLLTSMYNANPEIRDFHGRLPSAYLPKEKEALAKYFPNPLRTLLQNRNNNLYLLMSQPEINNIHTNTVSCDENSDDHSESGSLLNLPNSTPLPITPQFPWNQTNQNHTEDLRRGFPFTRSIGSRQGGRDSSRDRYHNRYPPFGLTNKVPLSSGDMKVLNMSFKRPSMKIRCDSPKRNLDSNFNYSDVELINNIYSLIRHKHQIPSLYNPLNPESAKATDYNQRSACRLAPSSLRSTVGRHWKRNAHSAYGSLRNTTLNLSGSTNTIDSDDFTDPPTPTNESNSEQ